MTVRHYSSAAGKMILQLGITAVATAMQVDTTAGLPGATPFSLLVDVGLPTEEIVTVNQVSGNTLVVVRGEDGTSAQPHASGAVVRHAITARDLRDSRDHEEATAGVHGVTGSVVGTTDTQTLTNKNLTSPSNVFPTTLATDAEVTAAVAAEATARTTADSTHAALTVAHGATGAVVGTTNAQTLTNKTINGPVIGTPTFADNVAIGDLTDSTQRAFYVRRKATTGTNQYESLAVIGASGGASGSYAVLLKENNVEVNRIEALADGTVVVGPPAARYSLGAVSAAKAGKRLHWGAFSGTTDNNGFVNVTHGAGFTPTVVTFTPTTALQNAVDTIGATTFRLRVVSSDGAPPGSPVSVAGTFFCGE